MKRIAVGRIFCSGFVILFFIVIGVSLSRAVAISAGVDEGYSAKVLDKVLKVVNPASALRDQSGVSILVYVDGDGKYARSVIRNSSGLKSIDDEFIAAIRKASPFGQPPYGQPAEIALTFKNDNAISKNGAPAQAAAPKPETVKLSSSDQSARQNYISSITREIRNSVFIPVEAKKGVYNPVAAVKIDKQGNISEFSIAKGSGDKTIDKYLLQGIKRKGKVTPPPAGIGQEFELPFRLVR